MESKDALAAFAALSQDMRLDALRLLIAAGPDGLAAGEIAARLDARANTLSANLSVLSQAGLVESQREGRHIRYRARMDSLGALVGFLLDDCCGGSPAICGPLLAGQHPPPSHANSPKDRIMPDTPFNVLFLCTGNSARSLIAEAVLNADPSGRFRAFSAGSRPAGAPNPHAMQLLERLGHDTSSLRSKSWDEFAAPGAPQMDFVFTVCDNAAAETCPVWPGQPMTAHWGVPDPAAATGTEAQIAVAFNETYRTLATRIGLFTALPLASLERLSLQRRLDTIGKTGA